MLNSILYIIFYLNGLCLHDFHVSVCEIEYDEKRKALEVTHKIFLDDLEKTLRNWSGDNTVDVTNPKDDKKFQQMLGEYLLENFILKANGKVLKMNYLGSEKEDDVMYCYIDIVNVKKLKSLEVKNTVLLDMYDDQTNIVHIEVNKETNSLKLNRNKPVDLIEY